MGETIVARLLCVYKRSNFAYVAALPEDGQVYTMTGSSQSPHTSVHTGSGSTDYSLVSPADLSAAKCYIPPPVPPHPCPGLDGFCGAVLTPRGAT